MRPYCFPMTAGNNLQTILLPTARSLLDITTLSGAEKEAAFMHEVEFANALCIISLGSICFTNSTCYSPAILFGRSWHRKAPEFPVYGFAAGDDIMCSGINITYQNELFYQAAARSKYHFDSNVFGAPKKYETSCYTISYKQTGGVTTGKVIATLPAVIFNCHILNEENVRATIAEAAFNNSLN